MLDLIRRTGREFGISLLLSSHLMGEVERTCDRIVVLEGGRVTQAGAVAQFTQETQTLFLEVDDKLDELMEALQKHGIQAELDGASVVVQDVTEEQYDDIRDALVDADSRLRRLAPRRGSLRDIFRGEQA